MEFWWSWRWQSVRDTETSWWSGGGVVESQPPLWSLQSSPPHCFCKTRRRNWGEIAPGFVEIGENRGEKIKRVFLWLLSSHQGNEETLSKTKSCSDTIGYKMVAYKINITENNGWSWCTLVLLYHEKCFTSSPFPYSSIALVHLKSNINWIHFAGLFLEFRFTNY